MTVIVRKDQNEHFTVDEVMWAKKQLVKAIVRQALISQTEATLDMVVDCQDQMDASELTRNGLQFMLKDVRNSAQDFLEDVLADFKSAVFTELAAAKYGAIVTSIKYDLAGDIVDVEVDLTVN